jgi:hypothetical protein
MKCLEANVYEIEAALVVVIEVSELCRSKIKTTLDICNE